MAKRVSISRIKKNHTYTVAELAESTLVSQLTVRRWIKDGMELIDDHHPTIIMGFSALSFLDARQSKAKQPMQLHEFYCLRCKAPKAPLGMMADYVVEPLSGGRLVALCSDCECTCNRKISAQQLPNFETVLDIIKRGRE